jgi:hypothetical protein
MSSWRRAAACLALAWGVTAVSAAHAQEAVGRKLAPTPYRIGIAPSHITKPTAPLFDERINDWEEVREQIDFHKVYSLQAVPPDWATPLPVDALGKFAKEHHMAVDAEFGNFRPGVGAGKDEHTAARPSPVKIRFDADR